MTTVRHYYGKLQFEGSILAPCCLLNEGRILAPCYCEGSIFAPFYPRTIIDEGSIFAP